MGAAGPGHADQFRRAIGAKASMPIEEQNVLCTHHMVFDDLQEPLMSARRFFSAKEYAVRMVVLASRQNGLKLVK